MKNAILAAATVIFLGSPVLHAQVDQSQVVSFAPSTPARASDMNQNFQALIAAIDSNTAMLKSLEDRLNTVASLTNLPQPTLQQNLAGSVYRIGILEASSGIDTDRNGLTEIGRLRHKLFSEEAILTLNADGSISIALDGHERETNINVNSGFDAEDPNNPFPLIMDVDFSKGDIIENETLNGTWALAGNLLTLDLGDGTESFHVSVDGNTLINNGTETEDDGGLDMFYANLDVGVRIHKPQPDVEISVDSVFGGTIFVPVNNGPAEKLNDTNGKLVVVKNTGTADLVIGSSAMVQEAGGDFEFTKQTGSITIAPGAEYDMLRLDNPLTQGSTRRDASIYIMTNDPDTPTFIVNIYSTNNP